MKKVTIELPEAIYQRLQARVKELKLKLSPDIYCASFIVQRLAEFDHNLYNDKETINFMAMVVEAQKNNDQ